MSCLHRNWPSRHSRGSPVHLARMSCWKCCLWSHANSGKLDWNGVFWRDQPHSESKGEKQPKLTIGGCCNHKRTRIAITRCQCDAMPSHRIGGEDGTECVTDYLVTFLNCGLSLTTTTDLWEARTTSWLKTLHCSILLTREPSSFFLDVIIDIGARQGYLHLILSSPLHAFH